MAIAIVEDLWGRIRAALHDEITAAGNAKEGAEAARDAAEAAADSAEAIVGGGAEAIATAAAKAEVDKLKAGAPAAFDTLKEIADELANNETERSALTNSIAVKADKTYVDERFANSTRSGISLLPMVPGTNTPMWAASFREVTDDVPPGENVAYANNEDASGIAMEWTNGWVKVTPGQKYRIRLWLKADTPGTGIVFWGYGDTDSRGIEDNTLGTAANYPVWIRNVPTEWTLYEGTFRIRDGVTALRIGGVTWNHTSSENTGAVQYVSGFEIWPDFAPGDHTHTSADITDLPSWSATESPGTLVQRSTASGNFQVSPPSHPQHVTTKEYVDTEVGKRAEVSHTHPVTDITATGTRSATTYLRGDGSWTTPTNTTYSVPTQAEAQAGTATTGRAFSAQRVAQAIDHRAAPKDHSHTPQQVGAAPAVHTHTREQVTGLDTALDGKAPMPVEVTGDNWPTTGPPGTIYWQEED